MITEIRIALLALIVGVTLVAWCFIIRRWHEEWSLRKEHDDWWRDTHNPEGAPETRCFVAAFGKDGSHPLFEGWVSEATLARVMEALKHEQAHT